MNDRKLFNDFVNGMLQAEGSKSDQKSRRSEYDNLIDDEPVYSDFSGARLLNVEKSTVNPGHYNQGTIQPWDFILDHDMGFLEGNIVKYITRYKKKGGREDLLKARTYLDKLLETTSP